MPEMPKKSNRCKILKRFLKEIRTGRSVPERQPKPAPVDWRDTILCGGLKNCPASEFHKLAEQFRAEERFSEADRICRLGLEIFPDHPWLSIIHAKIADSVDDAEASLTRWRKVIENSAGKAPARAFKNVADRLLEKGDFEAAEKVILEGLEIHAEDLNLCERLARTALAAGQHEKAILHWRGIIDSHPEINTAWIHRRIAETYGSEGLPERALAEVLAGLEKQPDDEALLAMRDRIVSRNQPLPAAGSGDFTAHLFGGNTKPFGKGVCSFPIVINPMNLHVPALLDFGMCQAPYPNRFPAAEVDVFFTWGSTLNPAAETAIAQAKAMGKPHLTLEFGFLSSSGLAINQTPQHSIIICPGSIYYDATQASFLEDRLNSEDYQLDERSRERAADCIRRITRRRVTKYNHAPQTDMRGRFPANGPRRVLLVDQRFGDRSVGKGLGSLSSFQRMWETALALPDHEILVKLHPDAISGGQGSYFARIVPARLPENVTIIAEEVNPYCLFEVVDRVFVCSSQLGFEALMAGLEVDCFGAPFYAGWGLTRDHIAIPRRRRRRTMEEIFHLFYIDHSRYFIPEKGISPIEDIIDFLAETADQTSAAAAVIEETEAAEVPGEVQKPRVVVVIPCPRLGASGRYIQTLSQSLVRQGCEVMVVADGKCPDEENGVIWRKMSFEGARLSAALRGEIVRFAPNIVYENGVRSRAQRAALEIVYLTGARLAMQSEDDDVQVFETHHGKEAAEVLALLDKPVVTTHDIIRYLGLMDLNHSMHVLLDPGFDRWVEPLTRMLCYRLAGLHTGIWQPFTERLALEYGVPTLVVPPVAADADFNRIPASEEERSITLRRHGIDPANTVIFIGGSLYSYSDEFSVFLAALNRASVMSAAPIALILTAGRSSLPVSRMARERLRPEISLATPDLEDDVEYLEILKACDIVCSPGLPDTFNRYRLPSRLVKAMAMGKPVLTCRCGFGESLEHGVNAFLTDGSNPEDWALSILPALDKETRLAVGQAGRAFSIRHFDSDRVADSLRSAFMDLLAKPGRTLKEGIEISRGPGSSPRIAKAGIKGQFRSHHESSMQEAIQELAAAHARPDTVVHAGAGRGREVEDYCRMGAARIVLLEASPALAGSLGKLANMDGTILVKQAAISPGRGTCRAYVCANTRSDTDGSEEFSQLKPTGLLEIHAAIQVVREESVDASTLQDVLGDMMWTSERNLLVLELNGLEGGVLESTPASLLHAFQWICMRLPENPLYENGATLAEVIPVMKAAGFHHVPASPNYAEPTVSALFTRGEEITALMKRCCAEPQRELALEFFKAAAGHAKESRAQLSQDLWALWECGNRRNGYFVEFGAMDGEHLSNTWLLEKKFGWTGIVAEPNPVHAKALSANRGCVVSLECVAPVTGQAVPFLATQDSEFSRMEEFAPNDNHESSGRRRDGERILVPTISLNDLLERSGAPEEPDFLSIDTEGSELAILESLDFNRWRFRTIAVEHNHTEAELRIDRLLVSKGYTRRFPAMSRFDGWYVRGDEAAADS